MAGNGKSKNLIQLKPNDKDYSQMWQIVPVLYGNIYGLVNAGTGYSANNSGGDPAEGTPVIEYDKHLEDSENQQWYLQKMELIVEDEDDDDDEETGINLFTEKDFIIYPNPVSDELIIHTPETNYGTRQDLIIRIFSIDGRCLFHQNFDYRNQIEIPVSELNLKSGMYILNIDLNYNKLSFKFFVR